ncbi:hypothetical protein SLS54_010529 [Diplodia seriata]
MAATPSRLSIGEDGTVSHSGSTPTEAVETNVTVWTPLPSAFEKARRATIFTRVGTRHSNAMLTAAMEATPDVDQSFCLCVNNVVLIFSASPDQHHLDVRKILQMLRDHSMRADMNDSVFDCANSIDAGIKLDQVGEHKVYMVINEGVPSH